MTDLFLNADGESGIQVKDISCAVTVVQREMEMPHSPSATGKGSNQVMAESLYDPYIRRKSLSRTMQQMDGGRDGSTNHWNFPSVPDYPEDCPGESKPLKLLHSHFQNEGISSYLTIFLSYLPISSAYVTSGKYWHVFWFIDWLNLIMSFLDTCGIGGINLSLEFLS